MQVRDVARYPARDLPALLARALPPDGHIASMQIQVVNYPLQVRLTWGCRPVMHAVELPSHAWPASLGSQLPS